MNEINIQSKSPDDYPDSHSEHVFAQYQLYLQMADNISDPRQSANTFFLSINTALVALNSYIKAATNANGVYSIATSVAGILICFVWYRLVLSYKNLNTAKFEVVHEIEKELSMRFFDAEWDAVGRGKDKTLYQPFSARELRAPWIFLGLHALVLAYIFPRRLIAQTL